MTSSRRNWIQEERRRTLGDWVAFCVACGLTLRFFDGSEADLPAACPHCNGVMRSRCLGCDALIASAFAIECEECGAPLRDPELFGGRIRRPGR